MQVYREARNAIIDKYREDPKRRLALAEVRASYSGDAGGLQRIHSFLDHWGLINYEAADGGAAQNASAHMAPFAVAPASEIALFCYPLFVFGGKA